MEQKYLFECEECSTKFSLGNDGVELKYGVPFTSKGGQSIFITYYDCPKCGKRHYVQIDDVHSNQMKKETSIMFKKLSKKRLNFQDISKKQNERFKRLNEKLEDYRFKLKKEFNGKVFTANDGSEVEVHFLM